MGATITYKACRNNLGECTTQQYRDYKSLVQQALEEDFPGATVTVGDSDFANTSQVFVDSDDAELEMDGPDQVQEIANRVFEDGEWAE